MITIPIFNTQGKEIDSLSLDGALFKGAVNTKAIYQAINAYLDNQRQGLASTKTRGEVSGGGKKPWKQKGTGRARVGSIRSPLWRHGGVVFGPHPRDFSCELPKKIKQVALRSVVCAKLKEDNLIAVDSLAIESAKTKDAVKILVNLKIRPAKGRILLLLEKQDEKVRRAFGNISALKINLAKDTNAYEVLQARKLLITKEGLIILTNRLHSIVKEG